MFLNGLGKGKVAFVKGCDLLLKLVDMVRVLEHFFLKSVNLLGLGTVEG